MYSLFSNEDEKNEKVKETVKKKLVTYLERAEVLKGVLNNANKAKAVSSEGGGAMKYGLSSNLKGFQEG